MDIAGCTPLAGARVDVWHARADGLYSGYAHQGDDHAIDTSGGTFMRGTQIADAQGEAVFRSVYPGWYEGRTTHVHFKIFVDAKHLLTGQMFFPDALSEYIYGHVSDYARKRTRDTFNANDDIALMDKARGGYCDLREEATGYLATLIVGVDRTAAPVAAEMPGPPLADGTRPPPPPGGFRGPPPEGLPPPRMTRPEVGIVPGIPLSRQKRG